MRILIIEDESSLAEIISTKLKQEKYEVDVCLDGEEGLYNALTNAYDLIILDIMLPNINGVEILNKIKEEDISSNVIMLTAKSSLDDKLDCFEFGADDYVTKPFHIEELIARVGVQLRKNNSKIKDEIEFYDLKLDIRNSILICKTNNETIELPHREFLLVEYFITNPNQIISKDQIYDKVWGIDSDFESNNLEAYISFVRKKLKIIESKVNIKSLRGLGYKMVVDYE